jgi:peptidoglycan L-alanyl-D-glutamate endopeptidase CwlK
MPTKDMNDACKAIRDHWDEIKRDFFNVIPTGHYLEIDCVYRSPAEQFELFKQGRTMGMDGEWHIQDQEHVVTNVDGHKVMGAHNYHPARAIDVCVIDNQTGKRLWDTKWYEPLIQIAARYGLVEGGTWRSFKDFPHLEIKDFKIYEENNA